MRSSLTSWNGAMCFLWVRCCAEGDSLSGAIVERGCCDYWDAAFVVENLTFVTVRSVEKLDDGFSPGCPKDANGHERC